jgi:glycosyltransferase involved in cell wall biosynthesis
VKKRAYFELLIKRDLERAARIHVTSEAELRALEGLGFGSKCAVIPSGVEVPPAVARSRSSAKVQILFLGRTDPIKGIPIALQALARAAATHGPKFEFVIAGSDNAGHRAELEREIARLRLQGAVRFLGFVSGDAKHRALSEADVLVLPSYHENLGVAAVEGMAHGLPVIVTDAVGIADGVRASGAGMIVPVGDVAALATAYGDMLDVGRRSEMGLSARSLAEREFSMAIMADRLMGLYEAVAAHRSATGD